MTRKDRYSKILEYFQKTEPQVTTELEFGSVFQLLVAVMLSAQCTDKRVNMVTPQLFQEYPDAKAMAEAMPEEIFQLIRSISYPNAKAKHLVETARIICEKYGGEVPQTFQELTSLPGVGRKTANVIIAVAFQRPAMPVDTHVFRVSHRLGLVGKAASTPLKVETQLKANIPAHLLADAHHWLLLHGRYICQSRTPKCAQCPFSSFCPSAITSVKVSQETL